jgi:hypothetical protein
MLLDYSSRGVSSCKIILPLTTLDVLCLSYAKVFCRCSYSEKEGPGSVYEASHEKPMVKRSQRLNLNSVQLIKNFMGLHETHNMIVRCSLEDVGVVRHPSTRGKLF